MVNDSHSALEPALSGDVLWKYVDFPRLASMLFTKSLWFTRLDQLADPFEGAVPLRTTVKRDLWIRSQIEKGSLRPAYAAGLGPAFEANRRRYAVNCWHIATEESVAMWEVYAQTSGFALVIPYSALKDALAEAPQTIYASKVKYIDFHKDEIEWTNMLRPVVHKRREYSFEQEFRLILSEPKVEIPVGQAIPFESSRIRRILVSPYAPVWYKALAKQLTEASGHTGLGVYMSSLGGDPSY